jgi:hypothetical protein
VVSGRLLGPSGATSKQKAAMSTRRQSIQSVSTVGAAFAVTLTINRSGREETMTGAKKAADPGSGDAGDNPPGVYGRGAGRFSHFDWGKGS